MKTTVLDDIDRRIINGLQGGFPLCPRPYAAAAEALDLEEVELLSRLRRLQAEGVISRFGPLFDAEKLGGAVTLAAMAVPEERFEAVAALVNAHSEVAHNYRRDHVLNMWFVVAAERPQDVFAVLSQIERDSGLKVLDLPKEEEFFLELRLTA